jgi:hypothetical protein
LRIAYYCLCISSIFCFHFVSSSFSLLAVSGRQAFPYLVDDYVFASEVPVTALDKDAGPALRKVRPLLPPDGYTFSSEVERSLGDLVVK